MKLLFHILLFILFVFKLPAQEAAIFNCIEVDNDGNTILQWIPQGSDNAYHAIFYSTNGITFDSIDNVPAISFSFTHTSAEADLGTKWYFIKSVTNSGHALSDTLQSIYLQVDNNDPDFNQADLYWNGIRTPFPDGYSTWYKILKEYPVGNWTIHDSVFISETTFSEPVIVCNDSITYRIIIENSIGCSSVSNTRGAVFRDVEYPLEPFFDSVSINQDEFPVLGWSPSESEDVTGYIIYRVENNNGNEIKRIYGRDSTYFIDSVFSPCNESFSYAIAALDSCGNKSPGTFLKPRNTIFLNDIDYNICSQTINLSWSAYLNAEPDLESYQIYYSIDNGPFSLAGQSNPGELTFAHTDAVPGFTYTYFVQALFGEGGSSSCKKMITTSAYQKPKNVYFANADVLITNNIELSIDIDTGINSMMLNIFREDPQTGITLKIDSISGDQIDTIPFVYADTDVDPNVAAYYYFAEVMDSCGLTILNSNDNKTILLSAENTEPNLNHLHWNSFEGWDAEVEKYYIFRMLNGLEPTTPIDSVDASTLEFTDDVSAIDDASGSPVYWVQAIENTGNEYGYKARSNSNRAVVAIASEMYLPTAFRPGGYTPEFKPVYRFYSGESYLLQIYNRWGQLIFETDNPEQGWDGKFKNEIVAQGVYIYKLIYQSPDQSSTEKRGTVTVIY